MLPVIEMKTDFCVVGGGLAGICAAVSASRCGAKVVLIHDRPVLGGNASSEIRMWVCGAQGKNVTETGILEEIFTENLRLNPYKLYPVFDAVLWDLVNSEKNITLLMNCSCMDCETAEDGSVISVTGWQMTTQKFFRITAATFADCSGDSILAPLSGASYRMGREAACEYGETVSNETEDKKTMGNSCLIQAHKGTEKVKFTAPAFAKKITDEDVKYRCPNLDSDYENFWYLELGGENDTIADAETVRDELVSLAFGMWDYVKNSGRFHDADYWQLDFLGFLPGKRESRRMIGKYVMTQKDILSARYFDDTVAYGGWPLDDHDPAGFYYDGHPNTSYNTPAPYGIPFRCLYSDNVPNLFFAGRNISMTHAAMSSARVMGTCALCGQAIGTAAAVAAKYNCRPHDVYLYHIDELQNDLLFNDCMLPGHPRKISDITREAKLTLNGKAHLPLGSVRDGNDRENVFECQPGDVISYSFDSPTEISRIRLIFDSDLDRETLPGSRCERFHMTRCNLLPDSPVMHLPSTLCSDFSVTAHFSDGTKKTVIECAENSKRFVVIESDLKDVVRLDLVMTSANSGGEKMRLFSFDIY